MKINVSGAKAEVGTQQLFSLNISAEELAITDGQLNVLNDILVEGSVINNGRVLEVRGTINALIREVCNRCLEEFSLPLTVEFAENFQQTNGLEVDDGEDLTYFEGDYIDIADVVRENLLLAQPLKPLCSENCKGLCPHCGVNLNNTKCDCIRENLDPRLAALQKFLDKK